MKLTGVKIGLVAICIVVLSTAVPAASHEDATMEKDTSSSMMDTMHKQHQGMGAMQCMIDGRAEMLQSADRIIGMAVTNKRNSMLGTIDDVVLDGNRQSIQYVILSTADTLRPVPWSALDSGSETYTLDISRDGLRDAPMISEMDMKQLNKSDFQAKAQAFYAKQITAMQIKHKDEHSTGSMKDQTESMTGSQKSNLMTVNHLIGLDVNDLQNQKLGELNDIVFDVRQGNLTYALVSFGRIIGSRTYENLSAAPWHSVRLNLDNDNVMIDADRSDLQASILPNRNINMLNEPAFARQVHQGFDQEPYWEVFGYIAPTGSGSMPMHEKMEPSHTVTGADWQPGSQFNKSFDPDTLKKTRARVIKVDTFSLNKDETQGLRIKVRTDQGRVMNVYAGPCPQYFGQDIRFDRGDEISITGSSTMVNHKNVLMACQVDKGMDTFKIRDLNGNPTWKVEMTPSNDD